MENNKSNPRLHLSQKRNNNIPGEHNEKRELSKDKIIITGLLGIGAILSSIVFESFHFEEEYLKIIGHLLRDGGIAFLSAAIISYIIEIPNTLKYFKELIIEALKDTNYLKDLSFNELERIKEKCNKLIFLKQGRKDESVLNESLIDFENEIFQLLMKPYYDYFIITVDCKDIKDNAGIVLPGECVKKTIQTNFKLVNPISAEKTEKLFSTPLGFYCPDDYESCDALFTVTRLRIKVDDEQFIDYTDKVKKRIENVKSTKYPNYNKSLSYIFDDGKDISFTFFNHIIVDLEEIRYISKDDKIYTKRIDKPTKNLTVNYLYDNPNFKIKADCFSTLPNITNDNLIMTEHENSVFVESKTWFLPGNGILIAIVPTEGMLIKHEQMIETKKTVETMTTTETTSTFQTEQIAENVENSPQNDNVGQ